MGRPGRAGCLRVATAAVLAVPLLPAPDHRALRVQRPRGQTGRSRAGRPTGSAPPSGTRACTRPWSCRSRPRSAPPRSRSLLGTLAAFASTASGSSAARRSRSSWSCRSRCPGIVTGMALNATFNTFQHPVRDLDDRHRPRDVLRRHRLQQRDRPAAALVAVDRGGLDGPGGRRLADLPPRHACRSCGRRCVAGGLLAFALSFDEVIVTTFTAGRRRRCRSGSTTT